MFEFRRTTVFYLGYRLSKHKMNRYAKNLGAWPLGPSLATPMTSDCTSQTNAFCALGASSCLRVSSLAFRSCSPRTP